MSTKRKVLSPTDNMYCTTDIAQPNTSRLQQSSDNNSGDYANVATITIQTRNSSESPTPPEASRTSFMCFSIHKEKELKENFGMTKNDDIIQKIAAAWRVLSAKERAHWDEEARKDKLRYAQEKAAYKGPWIAPRRRAKKHPLAPKRPMSAFLKFSLPRRKVVKQKNPDMSNTDVSRLLGEMWRNSTSVERAPYVEEEAKERTLYKQNVAKWRKEQARREAFRFHAEEEEVREDYNEDISPHSSGGGGGSRKASDDRQPLLFAATSTSLSYEEQYQTMPAASSTTQYAEDVYAEGGGRQLCSTGSDERDDHYRYNNHQRSNGEYYAVPENTPNNSNHRPTSSNIAHHNSSYMNVNNTSAEYNHHATLVAAPEITPPHQYHDYYEPNSYKFDYQKQQHHNNNHYNDYPQQRYSNDTRSTIPSMLPLQTANLTTNTSTTQHNRDQYYYNQQQQQQQQYHAHPHSFHPYSTSMMDSSTSGPNTSHINTTPSSARYSNISTPHQSTTMTRTDMSDNNNDNTEDFVWRPYSQHRHHHADYSDHTSSQR